MISSGRWPRVDGDTPGVIKLIDPIGGTEYRAVIPAGPTQWEGPTRRGRGARTRAGRDLDAELALRVWLTDRQETTTCWRRPRGTCSP